MAIKCPRCHSKEFYLVIEPVYSFKIKDIGLEDVIPEKFEDECTSKTLLCDECGFSGWINEYWLVKHGVVLTFDWEEKEEE